MADSTLAALGAHATAVDADSMYIENGGVAKKVAASVLKTYVSDTPTLVTPDIGTPSAGVATNLTGAPAFAITNMTGTGTNLTFVTPALGTPASGVLDNCTGAPTLTNATLVTPALGTPSALVLTNATGTLTSPTFVTPALGTPASGVISNCTSSGMVMVAPVLGTPASGDLSNCTGAPGLVSATLTTPLIDDSDAGVTITSADQTNAAAVVTIPDIADAADTFVMVDTTQTLTNKTLTAPAIATTGAIVDAGGDEYVVFTESTTPVTYVGITSGDLGVAPRVQGAGEANTDLHLLGSGTGNVVISDGTDPTKDVVFELNGATTLKTTTFLLSQTDDRSITFPDATDTLVGKDTTDTLTNKTLTSPVIDTIVADLSVTGTIESADAATPILSTAAGSTNTGYLSLTGKTSGSLKILPADAMAQVVTIAPAAQTSGASTLTIPDQAGVSSNFVFDTLAATLTNKTLVAPALGTVASGDISACTGNPVLGQPAAEAITATVGGGTTGLITATTKFAAVTSDDADKQISLPAAVGGKELKIFVAATGCELISAVAADKVNNVVVGATNEAALVAGTLYTCVYDGVDNWVMTGLTNLGVVEAPVVPDSL